MRYLAAEPPRDGARPAVILQGVPYDGGVSWRAGAAGAPRAIREASDSIESYSLLLERDLEDVALADAGDVPVAPAGAGGGTASAGGGTAGAGGLRAGAGEAEALMERVATATREHARIGAVVVTLGGDHSISMGTSRGLRAVYDDLVHVVYDAHLDMRTEYDGDPFSHACGTRRMAEAGPTGVLGARSASRDEHAVAREMLAFLSHDVVVGDAVRSTCADRPVFVSVDCDVLDPSTLPGTGNPEPGGIPYTTLRRSLLDLCASERVVGVDFCEVAPSLDPSGASAIVVAELVRDVILGLRAAQ